MPATLTLDIGGVPPQNSTGATCTLTFRQGLFLVAMRRRARRHGRLARRLREAQYPDAVRTLRRRRRHRRESCPADLEHLALHERAVPAARPSVASRARR